MDVAKIEDKLDKTIAGATPISMELGGIRFDSMIQLFEFSKLMAISGLAVPVHLRGNPGACLAVCTKALRYGFDPFALAEHSYSMVKSSKVDGRWEDVETIAYDSFVIHAIIEAHAPITGRLRIAFEGEGDERTCTVSAMPRGETVPLELKSPTLGELKRARGTNEKGQIKGSPLWLTKPDQQLAYDTRRDFCRRHFPEILLGWYDKEELQEGRAAHAKDVTPKPTVAERLPGKAKSKRGFDNERVQKETQIEGKAEPEQAATEPAASEPEPEPDPRALAYNAGEGARVKGLPLNAIPPEYRDDDELTEAYKDGWRTEDKVQTLGAG